MTARRWTRGTAAVGLLLSAGLLAGCASTQAARTQHAGAPNASAQNVGAQQTGAQLPGMVMTSAPAASKPTATALMVCSDDIKGKVKQVLALPGLPPTTASFANAIYTCAYHLPVGPLVLSVQHADSKLAAHAYYTAMRSSLGSTEPLLGLGDEAFGSAGGVAVVRKDNETLVVDARGVPAVFGSNQQKRTDLADEVASDVLGCWTGSD